MWQAFEREGKGISGAPGYIARKSDSKGNSPGTGFSDGAGKKRAETELHYGLKYGKDNKNTT